MSMRIEFKDLTDNVLEFLRGIPVTQKYCLRGYPWMYIFGTTNASQYFPSFFVIPPTIQTVSQPIHGSVVSISYPVYYVIRIDDLTESNPAALMEDAIETVVEAFEENPFMNMREFVDAGSYSVTLENDMTFWARDLSQPYMSAKFMFTFMARTQRD